MTIDEFIRRYATYLRLRNDYLQCVVENWQGGCVEYKHKQQIADALAVNAFSELIDTGTIQQELW